MRRAWFHCHVKRVSCPSEAGALGPGPDTKNLSIGRRDPFDFPEGPRPDRAGGAEWMPKPMAHADKHYDLIIIGGSITGGMLGAAMARNGVRVLILEKAVHPRFAIGESMILETSEIMRSLAFVFDVPELEYFSAENFLPLIGTSHGVKRHFSYLPHREGETPDPKDLIQAVIPKDPYGHELHIHRQDCDYFYMSVAVKYGADVRQGCAVEDIDLEADGVSVKTADGDVYRCDYVVDAGGRHSLLADRLKLRHTDLRTHTRGLFTHMRDVPSVHKTFASSRHLDIPFSLSEGTLHHVFEGGWLWVIPFDNHADASSDLCSVGLVLNPRVHGLTPDMPPEEEFGRFIARYPTIAAHLGAAKPVRPWGRADRLQYSASRIVGDRYALIGHAAGFIDPLFSKGLYTSLAAILSFGRLFLKARREGDFRRTRFMPLEETTLAYIDSNDRLAANAIKSFAFPALWRQYAVIWIAGAYLELVRLTTYRQSLLKHCRTRQDRLDMPVPDLHLVGGGFQPFDELAALADALVEEVDPGDPTQAEEAARRLQREILERPWIPYSHKGISQGQRALPKDKFNWRLALNKGGILGEPEFRQHFFHDTNLVDLAAFMAREKWRYSRQALKARRARLRRDAL